MAFASSFGGTATHNPNKSFEIQHPPNDGISSLSWSPTANHLVVTPHTPLSICKRIYLHARAHTRTHSPHAGHVVGQ